MERLAVLLEGAGDEEEEFEMLARMFGEGDEGRDEREPPGRSRSHDSAHAGVLHGAVQVPGHPAYVVRDRSRAWGTAETIARLVQAFDQVVASDAAAPRVRVHDLSLPHGGPMDGHKSHQSGRDVDISYYRRSCPGNDCMAQHVTPAELDAGRQWQLLRYWLERGQAEFIFIHYALQRPLYEAARAGGASAEHLASWFQYPRGASSPSGIVRHVDNHANHLHVRFRCPNADRDCKSIAMRRAAGDSERVEFSTDEIELLELLAE